MAEKVLIEVKNKNALISTAWELVAKKLTNKVKITFEDIIGTKGFLKGKDHSKMKIC